MEDMNLVLGTLMAFMVAFLGIAMAAAEDAQREKIQRELDTEYGPRV